MAIADYECEPVGAGALLGRHRLRIRHVQIQRGVRADSQQCNADKTANGGKQVASDVELRHLHFVPHSIAPVAPNSSERAVFGELKSDTSIPRTAILQMRLRHMRARRSKSGGSKQTLPRLFSKSMR